MKPPISIDTSSFLLIQLHEMGYDLEDELTDFMVNFGLWYPDSQTLMDLIEGKADRYVEEFKAKRLSDTHSEWYYDIGIQRDETEVAEFFDRFKKRYADPLLNSLARMYRVVHSKDTDGYSHFQVIMSAFIFN